MHLKCLIYNKEGFCNSAGHSLSIFLPSPFMNQYRSSGHIRALPSKLQNLSALESKLQRSFKQDVLFFHTISELLSHLCLFRSLWLLVFWSPMPLAQVFHRASKMGKRDLLDFWVLPALRNLWFPEALPHQCLSTIIKCVLASNCL